MSNLKRCDQCGKELFANGWGDVAGAHLRFEADLIGGFEGDFCSWRCVADYAQKRATTSESARRRTRPVRPDATDRSLIPTSPYDERPRRRLRLFP